MYAVATTTTHRNHSHPHHPPSPLIPFSPPCPHTIPVRTKKAKSAMKDFSKDLKADFRDLDKKVGAGCMGGCMGVGGCVP
jgi:hypothetical protein